MSFILTTDSDSDLPLQFVEENQIHVFSVPVLLNGTEFEDDLGKSYSYKEFYDTVRNGSLPTTSQINVYTFFQKFEEWVKAGKEILYISFSSQLSGIYNSAMTARAQILEEYPQATITIIDSLCVSGGQGLLVYYANEMRKNGDSLIEVAQQVEEMKQQMVQVAMVQNLDHLVRGGRVSPLAGFVGSLLQLKPLLYVTQEGKIEPYQKVRGKKKAIRTLVETFDKCKGNQGEIAYIVHADCEEDAQELAQVLKSNHGVQKIIMSQLGPGIGSHTGADTLVLCFVGQDRVTHFPK